MKNNLLKIIIVLLIIQTFLATIAIAGIGVSPARLDYEKVLRGGSSQRDFTLFNTEEREMKYNISVSGEMQDWFIFYPSDSISIPAKSSMKITAEVNVPEDMENDIYETFISIKPNVEANTSDGANLGIVTGVGLKTSIEVTGEQIVSGKVNRISVEDAEVGSPVIFTIDFSNKGNVRLKPEASIEIRKNGQFVDSFEKILDEAKPGQTKKLNAEWNTASRETGDYNANVKVMIQNNTVREDEVNFKILSIGSLETVGILESINVLTGNLGEMTKITAVFRNTGETGTKAKFKAEIYYGEGLADTVKSEEILVLKGEKKNMDAYFKPDKTGSYNVKGKVFYGTRETEQKEASFEIMGSPITGMFYSSELAIGAVITILIIVIIIKIRKR